MATSPNSFSVTGGGKKEYDLEEIAKLKDRETSKVPLVVHVTDSPSTSAGTVAIRPAKGGTHMITDKELIQSLLDD